MQKDQLIALGFTSAEAEQLLTDLYFKENIVSFDKFKLKMEQALTIYGKENEPQIKKSILSFPQFASLDHSRVLRQKLRLARVIGFPESEVISIILQKPVESGCSFARDLAAIDVFRQLAKEKDLSTQDTSDFVKIWLKSHAQSPYVPGTKKLRMSQAKKLGINAKPPLYNAVKNKVGVFKLG